MKQKLYLLCVLFWCTLMSYGQTTILTNHPSNNGNGSVIFNVQNTNSYAIKITGVNCLLASAANNNIQLLYNTIPFSDNSPPWSGGIVGANQNGWVLAGTNNVLNSDPLYGIVTVLSNLSLIIPAGTTYQLGLSATAMQYSTLTNVGVNSTLTNVGVNTFSANGVNLLTGDGISWGGLPYPSTPGNYPRGLIGGITFEPVSSATHLNFDGTNDFITAAPAILANQSFSTEFWAKKASNGTHSGIISQGLEIGIPDLDISFKSNNKFSFGTFSGNLDSNATITDFDWHHWAVTYDANSNTQKIYLDGVLDNTIVNVADYVGSGFLNIGKSLSTDSYFNGSLDDVRIWNVARTAEQINGSKNCELQGSETGLVAYYKFNQGLDAANNTAITTATATTGSGGTLSGFTLTGATSNFLSGSPVTTGSTIPTAPTASAQSYCSATTANSLVPAISATIKWYASQTTTTALATTDNLTTGTYYVVAVNANGCESDRTEILVNVGISSVTSQTNVSCNGGSNGSATVNPSGGTGGYTYSWSPSGGTAATATGLSAGTYTVTVTDANGCTTTANFVITEPTSIAFSTLSLPNRDYNQSYSQTVVATGGVGIISYSLTSGSLPTGFTLSNPGVISGTSTDIGTFTFIVIATDANGCSISQNLSIGLNQIPVAVTAIAASKVYGTSDPVLTYSVSPSLSAGDSFTGSLTRTAGENVDNYAISQGTLSAGSGYLITFVGANFDIVKADQIIVWNQDLEVGCNNETTVILTASASSGLPVTYNSSNSNIATVTGDVLTIINSGTADITASQSGDSNYNPATNVINTLLVNQPALIRKHWRDVLFFDNSSNSYSNYQWFKNGVSVSGANQQYFKENGDLQGTYYATALQNGILITTCSITFTVSTPEFDLKVVPNPVLAGSTVDIETTLPTTDLQNAQLVVYSLTGVIVSQHAVTNARITINAPNAQGVYIVRLQLSNGNIYSVNLLVK